MTPISSVTTYASHAESLHNLLVSQDIAAWDASLQACHDAISKCVPCVTRRRSDDMVLQIFIEASDTDWHLADSPERQQVRDLFHRYVDAGFLRVDRPVTRMTARELIGVTNNPPPDIFPLVYAVRRGCIATAVALIEEGANTPVDLLETAWQHCPVPRDAPALAAALTEALMRLHLVTHAAHQVAEQRPSPAARRSRVL